MIREVSKFQIRTPLSHERQVQGCKDIIFTSKSCVIVGRNVSILNKNVSNVLFIKHTKSKTKTLIHTQENSFKTCVQGLRALPRHVSDLQGVEGIQAGGF